MARSEKNLNDAVKMCDELRKQEVRHQEFKKSAEMNDLPDSVRALLRSSVTMSEGTLKDTKSQILRIIVKQTANLNADDLQNMLRKMTKEEKKENQESEK